MALRTIRTQKLKSFFSLIGVLIGVTFLIAVVSIVQGMNRYMEERFANGLIGVNSFEVRRMPAIDNGNVSAETWREWLRRPRVNYREAAFLAERVKTPAIWARVCWERELKAEVGGLRGQVEIQATDNNFFRIKGYRLASGRTFTPQESRTGEPVAVIGASPGQFGAIWAQRELKKVLGIMSARVLDVELAVAKADRRLAEPDPSLREELAVVVSSLVAAGVTDHVAAVA